LLGLFFDLEDGDAMFLRNFGWLSMDYMAFYPRRYNSSLVHTSRMERRTVFGTSQDHGPIVYCKRRWTLLKLGWIKCNCKCYVFNMLSSQ
jgi:hypothetical protein